MGEGRDEAEEPSGNKRSWNSWKKKLYFQDSVMQLLLLTFYLLKLSSVSSWESPFLSMSLNILSSVMSIITGHFSLKTGNKEKAVCSYFTTTPLPNSQYFRYLICDGGDLLVYSLFFIFLCVCVFPQ